MPHKDMEHGLHHLREAEIRNGTYKVSMVTKQYPPFWNERKSILAAAILPLLRGNIDDVDAGATDSKFYPDRYEIMNYVDACEAQGFCHDILTRQACARRWMAGKRKISAPFTKTRKRAAIAKRKALASAPVELVDIIKEVLMTSQGDSYRGGNDKALNALVGMVLKRHKYDAAAVKEIIQLNK